MGMGADPAVARQQALRQQMAASGIAALLIVDGPNRRYLTGFTGSAGWVAVLPGQVCLLTDGRYTEQAGAEAPSCRLVQTGTDGPAAALPGLLAEAGVSVLHAEGDRLAHLAFTGLADEVAPVQLRAVPSPVPDLRMVKDDSEIRTIRQAAAIAETALAEVMSSVRPGVTERELALALEVSMRRQGASDRSFETIVASGPRSALPHGTASNRALGPGDLVTFDFGCVFDGYCSDLTRTVAVGEPDPELRAVHGIVEQARAAAVAAVRPGVTGQAVHEAAFKIIDAAGYGPYFTHSTGHGVGLEVHEGPRLSATGTTPLAAGMIVTVEPGIYLPGRGGVRIEDMVQVTDTGAELLTHAPRQLVNVSV